MDSVEVRKFIENSLKNHLSEEDIYADLIKKGLKIKEIKDLLENARTEKNQDQTEKRTIKVVLTIGAVLVGAGVFSLIASNWEDMAKAWKVFVIVFSMLLSYFAAWYFSQKKGYEKTGSALYLLGILIYGAGIFLIAQIFNISANWPDGFILWMFGSLTLYFAVKNKIFLYLSFVLGLFSIFGHPAAVFDVFHVHDRFLLTSSVFLLLAAVVCFVVASIVEKKNFKIDT